jgi:hypothetical protein
MGTFTYKIVLLNILFLKKLGACNDCLKFQWGQLLRCSHFSIVNEPTEIVSVASMTPLNRFSGVTDPAEILQESFEFLS